MIYFLFEYVYDWYVMTFVIIIIVRRSEVRPTSSWGREKEVIVCVCVWGIQETRSTIDTPTTTIVGEEDIQATDDNKDRGGTTDEPMCVDDRPTAKWEEKRDDQPTSHDDGGRGGRTHDRPTNEDMVGTNRRR